MLKNQSSVILALLVVVVSFNAFLAWRWSAFRSEYDLFVTRGQGVAVTSEKMQERVAALESLAKDQGLALKKIADAVAELPKELRRDLRDTFVALPEFAVHEKLFVTPDASGGVVTATADMAALDAWQARNKLFLDAVLQDSLVLDVDVARPGVTVTRVVADSLYYQMGLRQGDVIRICDGRLATNSDDVRFTLTEFRSVKVELERGGARITLDIVYPPPGGGMSPQK